MARLQAPHYTLSRWLFLRGLGIIYLIAFASFAVQVPGLIGRDGILPAAQFLDYVRANTGTERYWLLPTLAWLNASDGFLLFLAWGGAFLALLLILDLLTAPVLALLWLFYLSLVSAGQGFMGFQWDALLLEAGFLAIFFAPWAFWRGPSEQSPPSRVVLFLQWWLLFRLMFLSGVVKLASGDPTWRNLTAMSFHYQTQPLPPPVAWYIHKLPLGFHKAETLFTFAAELVVPFFYFAPRRLRFAAGAVTILLQLLILLTGNYTFFNLLTIVLCIPLFDDTFLRRFVPARVRQRVLPIEPEVVEGELPDGESATPAPVPVRTSAPRVKRGIEIVLAAIILLASVSQIAALLRRPLPLPRVAEQTLERIAPFRVVNRYGLFAVMTTTRPEIIIEGSNDGGTWLAYDYKFKPDDLQGLPPIAAPHQPRLDWQLWFAALGSPAQNGWFGNLLVRLLEGSPQVLDLFASNPFPDRPPRYIRALLYEYEFTDSETRAETGAWWQREPRGIYFPAISLDDVSPR